MTEGAAWRYTAMQAEAGRDAASGTPSPSSPKSPDVGIDVQLGILQTSSGSSNDSTVADGKAVRTL